MQPSQLSSYLTRIGLTDADVAGVQATHTLLDRVMGAHLRSIPFENLDVGPFRSQRLPISMEFDDVFSKLVVGKRGGYCFEHNTLMQVRYRMVRQE
jgi:N-hydroxyarylamine O-acetyltransferase